MAAPAEAIATPAATWVEGLAAHLYPHRVSLLAAGLGAFVLGVLPLVAVALECWAAAAWQALWLGFCAPITIWAIGLANWAVFFDPQQGLLGSRARRGFGRHRAWLRAARGYAGLTLCAFALAPLWLWIGAAR